jgi:hypothetical protein
VRREFVVVHHSLTKDGETVSWGAIEHYHTAVKGWRDIGYHAGVELVGGRPYALLGRDVGEPAAACREVGMNVRGLHVCVVGNFDVEGPTEDVMAVLARRVVLPWMLQFDITAERVIGHRDAGLMDGLDWTKGQYKSCPGRAFDLERLRRLLR